jgi:hypothetical protein
VKKSVGNNVKEALHNVLLLFTFLPTLFFTPFSSVVEMPENEDGHVHSYSPVLIWDTLPASDVFFIGVVPTL